jgi:hypothetical protein
LWTRWAVEAITSATDDYEKYEEYYEGDHELEFATDRWKTAFGNEFEQFADNWCQVVVDSLVQRMEIIGWESEDEKSAAKKAEEIWDRLELGIEADDLHLQTTIKGDGYLFVWPNPDNEREAQIFYNDATEVAVFYDPSNRRRIARACKRYQDERGQSHLWIYTEDGIQHFIIPSNTPPEQVVMTGLIGMEPNYMGSWVLADDFPNNFGTLPIFHFKNRSRGSTHGLSELKIVIPVQNAVNKTLMDMMVASEFGSFRQKYIAGGGVPKNTDGTTGWRAGSDRVWHTTDPNTRFGEFGQVDLEPIFKAVESLVGHIAKITQTPMHYLRTQGDMPSGEAMKTAESGLVKKCFARQKQWGSTWSKAMTFAVEIETGSRPKSPLRPIWKSPETRHDLEQAQTAQLKSILGIPLEKLWSEHFGYTEEQIAEFKKMNLTVAASVLAQVIQQIGQAPPGTEPVTAKPQELMALLQAGAQGANNTEGSGLNLSQVLAMLPKTATAQTSAGEATAKPQANTRPPASPTRRSTGFKD